MLPFIRTLINLQKGTKGNSTKIIIQTDECIIVWGFGAHKTYSLQLGEVHQSRDV